MVSVHRESNGSYNLTGFEDHRGGVKKVFNALLFDTRTRTSFPKGANITFPPNTKAGDVVRSIADKHPKDQLCTRAGFDLMFLESEIMMRVLEWLREDAIVGLPVFDAVLVKASMADAAMAVMKEVFEDQTGLAIKVRLGGSVNYPAPRQGFYLISFPRESSDPQILRYCASGVRCSEKRPRNRMSWNVTAARLMCARVD